MHSFSPFSVCLLLGIIQGVIIAALLFRQKTKLNIFLALLILNIVSDLFSTLLIEQRWFDYYPNFYFIPVNYSLGYGPLIYFTTIYFVNPGIHLSKKYYWDFLPVIIQAIFYWVVFWFPLHLKAQVYTGVYVSVVLPAEYYGTIISMVINLFLSFKYLRRQRAGIILSGSYGSRIYTIAKSALYVFAVLLIVWVSEPVLTRATSLKSSIDALDLLFVLTVYALGITAFYCNALIKQHHSGPDIIRTPLISTQQQNNLIGRINHLMEVDKIYKNPNLSLQELADQLSVNVKVISYVINSGMDSTFSNLVNSYRIMEVKSQIANRDNDHLTLLGIAYNSGFNSKSSFNLIFKQFTGITPKEYKVKIRQVL